MKKILLIVATLASGLTMNAQLTQANNAISASDTYTLYQCDSLNINPGAAGAGAIWNFSAIATRSSIVNNYSASVSTNTTAYPTASIAVGSSANDINYLSSNAGAQFYHGGPIVVSPVAASLFYTMPAIIAAYPMSLNTSSSAAIAGSINVTTPTAASGTFVGNSTTLADGTGTLNLPGGLTYSNVTRVVNSQTITFNILLTVTITQKSFEYYEPNIKGALFSIKTATFYTSFGAPTTQTFVTRFKGAAPTQTVNTSVSSNFTSNTTLSVYPNPSSSTVNFYTTNSEAQTVLVYDITGKQVEKLNLTAGRVKLDVSSYNKGLYLYTLVSDNGKILKSGKLTVSE